MNNIEHEQQDSSESSNMNAQSMLSVNRACVIATQDVLVTLLQFCGNLMEIPSPRQPFPIDIGKALS